jgi:hypothetical protein
MAIHRFPTPTAHTVITLHPQAQLRVRWMGGGHTRCSHRRSHHGWACHADATMTDSACVHPAVALVDEPGLGRSLRAVGNVERGALLLHEAPIIVTSTIQELPEPLQATYRAVSTALPFSRASPRRRHRGQAV